MKSINSLINFIGSKGFKRYFSNTSWMLFNKISSLVVAFAVGIYVARYLGPENFGILNFAKSIAMFFITFSALGLESNILSRNLLQTPQRMNEILGTSFAIRLVSSSIIIVSLLLLFPLFANSKLTYILIIMFAASSVFNAFNVIKQYFESEVKSKLITITVLIGTIISSIFKLYLIHINASLLFFASATLLESIILAFGLIIIYNKKFGNLFFWKFNNNYAKELLNDSWPLLFSGFIVLIYMKTDQIMIKFLIDDEAVGYYAVAVRISEVWIFLGTLVCSSLFPAIVNAKKRSLRLYHARMQHLYDLMVYLAIIVALPISFTSEYIIKTLFGNEFIASANVLKIHVWSMVFVYIGAASNKWLIAENLQKIKLYRIALGAVMNVGLNFVLIPSLGIQGAAIATLISQAFATYFGYLLSKKTLLAFTMQSRSLLFISSFSFLRKGIKNIGSGKKKVT